LRAHSLISVALIPNELTVHAGGQSASRKLYCPSAKLALYSRGETLVARVTVLLSRMGIATVTSKPHQPKIRSFQHKLSQLQSKMEQFKLLSVSSTQFLAALLNHLFHFSDQNFFSAIQKRIKVGQLRLQNLLQPLCFCVGNSALLYV
jgi:hypothetical protein